MLLHFLGSFFIRGKKIWCSCCLFPIIPLMYQTGRWAINSYPLFHNCSLCLWASQITSAALYVFSLRFSREQLVQGKYLSPLRAFETLPWGKDCKCPGQGLCTDTFARLRHKGAPVFTGPSGVSARLQSHHDNPPFPCSSGKNNRDWQWKWEEQGGKKGRGVLKGGRGYERTTRDENSK